jgi:hypothetical protein
MLPIMRAVTAFTSKLKVFTSKVSPISVQVEVAEVLRTKLLHGLTLENAPVTTNPTSKMPQALL